jgi:Putative translation initiation inhibitor, yjgF family
MTRRLISSGSPFEEIAGYSRAVAQDPWVFVSGTSGYKDGKISESEAEQADQALQTIQAALAQAGATMDDVVRVMVYITDAAYFQTVGPVLGKYFKKAKPANTTIVCGLVDAAMKVEIQVTALKS